ncbi:MAG: phosphoribosyltransferase family protein, partial [Pirellulales bacterium]
WVRQEVPNPVLVGPDEESGQWVEEIAGLAGARYAVLRKERRGDYDVSISAANLPDLSNLTPVIIDDIASSARTMISALRSRTRTKPWPSPIAFEPPW